ncbi:hypothetical protein [Metapseudomonas furukawaii]|uniref:hypothetical protein n=1 Tax=Metapseudomonas furukawaii TaxID=1149133 RepID=UPI0005696BFD|nr:hypothetical protein [Pseudomonas furukawaii]
MENTEAENLLRGYAFLASAALVVMAILYWFGVITFGPLELFSLITAPLTQSGDASVSHGGPLSGLFEGLRVFVGGMLWIALAVPVRAILEERVAILQAGSRAAYKEQLREAERLANAPQSLGKLVAVTHSKGGFLGRDESLIETSEGFYRVVGLVGGVKKGEPVSRVRDTLQIGSEDAQRQFNIIG